VPCCVVIVVSRGKSSPAHCELVCYGLESHFTTRASDATSAAARRVDPRSPLQGSSSAWRGTRQPHLWSISKQQMKHYQCRCCLWNIACQRHHTAETHPHPQAPTAQPYRPPPAHHVEAKPTTTRRNDPTSTQRPPRPRLQAHRPKAHGDRLHQSRPRERHHPPSNPPTHSPPHVGPHTHHPPSPPRPTHTLSSHPPPPA